MDLFRSSIQCENTTGSSLTAAASDKTGSVTPSQRTQFTQGPFDQGEGRPRERAQELTLYNTLTRQRDVFVPLNEHGRNVTWYTCGPTVYDSAHLGHARYYVTMDMLRRVMETHFGYNIDFVMNVTDIDDKIIKRARLNHLRDQYLASTPDDSKVLQEVLEAMTESAKKQQQTRDEVQERLDEEASASGSHKQRSKDLSERLRMEDTKLQRKQQNLKEAESLRDRWHETANGSAESSASSSRRDRLIELGGDDLAEKLDSLHGGEVTDHSIYREHAGRYEQDFLDDLEKLGCKMPSDLTRVSDFILEITEYIDKIHQNGMAYSINGSVYFDTQAFVKDDHHKYGKLAPQAVGSLQAEDGEANFATKDKKSPKDFALWKAAKPGEPSWPSPKCAQDAACEGRPGWHIECSAMASHMFGQSMDIHTGGADLAFPHHENEVAQAEAYYHHEHRQHCCNGTPWEPQWVNYFLHVGHLNINGCKMSKSLKNFISIRKALERTHARVLRLMFAMAPWERPMTYTDGETEAEAQRKDEVLKSFFARAQALLAKFKPVSRRLATKRLDKEDDLAADLTLARNKVDEALLDSINLSGALDALFDLVKSANRYMDEREASAEKNKDLQPRAFLLGQVTEYVGKILSEFGIEGYSFGGGGGDAGSRAADLQAFAGFRGAVRDHAKSGLGSSSEPKDALKNILQAADRVRDKDMPDLGIRLEDRADGSWIIKEMSPDEQKEIRDGEAAARAKEEKRQKEAREAEQKRQSSDQDKLKKLEMQYASLQAAEDPKKKAASIKNLWATLKQLKVGPQDHTFGPDERRVVEDILSGSRNVHEKQRQGFEAAWALLNRADASDADKQKAERELLQKIKEALPEATEPWLIQIVPQKLKDAGL
ncbi:g10837 [Coccomyxa viridis]|uniref:cysteine--tRNA ligase n=1 Tax=Coccomyxa viridis TaxID=1274662 RepID=A0ABP1G6B9_9CHLO